MTARTAPAQSSACPSRYSLVELAAGELATDSAHALERHLAACARCSAVARELREHIDEHGQASEAHLAALLAKLADGPKGRARSARVSRAAWLRSWIWPALGGACAAAVAATWLGLAASRSAPHAKQIAAVAYRGSLGLQVVRKRGDAQRLVADRDTLYPKDALRFTVTVAHPGYVLIVGVDAERSLWPCYPDQPLSEPAWPLYLDRPGRHVLPGSVVLDQSLGDEALVLVFSKDRFPRRSVLTPLLRAAANHELDKLQASDLGIRAELAVLHYTKAANARSAGTP